MTGLEISAYLIFLFIPFLFICLSGVTCQFCSIANQIIILEVKINPWNDQIHTTAVTFYNLYFYNLDVWSPDFLFVILWEPENSPSLQLFSADFRLLVFQCLAPEDKLVEAILLDLLLLLLEEVDHALRALPGDRMWRRGAQLSVRKKMMLQTAGKSNMLCVSTIYSLTRECRFLSSFLTCHRVWDQQRG